MLLHTQLAYENRCRHIYRAISYVGVFIPMTSRPACTFVLTSNQSRAARTQSATPVHTHTHSLSVLRAIRAVSNLTLARLPAWANVPCR